MNILELPISKGHLFFYEAVVVVILL